MSYELRPLTLAEILDAAFRLVQNEWRTLIGLSLIMQIPIALLTSQASWVLDPFSDPFESADEITPDMLMEMGLLWLVLFLAYLVLYPFVAGAVTAAVGNFYLGRHFSIGDAARAGRSVIIRMILAYVAYTIGIGLAAAVVVGISIALASPFDAVLDSLGAAGSVIGVIILIVLVAYGFFWFIFASAAASLLGPVIVLESKGVFASVTRVFRLGATSKWRLIGIVFTAGMIVGVPVFGAQMLIGFIPYFGLIVWALFQAVGFAFTTSVAVVLYFDFRCRSENYDLELLAEQVEAGPGLGSR